MGLRGPRLACDRCRTRHELGNRPEDVSARSLWRQAAGCGWKLIGEARLCPHCVEWYRQLTGGAKEGGVA